MEHKTYGVAKNGVTMKIELTEKEAQICSVLRGVSSFIAQERPELPIIESRIAGGWVRDKLLGNECHDLDVAINDMMGYEFATYVNKYLENQGVPTRSIAKIDSNPEKSKHLETATTKLFNQEVDFCNLRTEIYEEGSRIPSQVTFGTPSEDAYRRDTTINSLFYNINTGSVEDFTERGIPDLIKGCIRTPLAPFETFRDDPLRVIRCIRFSSRFNFEMVPELCEAAKHPEIKDALVNKISRERIGTEFDKMITGPFPHLSLQLIEQLGLYPVMMAPPADIKRGIVGEGATAVTAVGIVEWLCSQTQPLLPSSKDEKRTLVLTASVLPFLGVMAEQKKREVPAVQFVLRESIKTNNVDVNTVSTIFRGIEPLQVLAHKNSTEQVKRSELGMLIRDLGVLWQTAIKMTAVKELLDTHPTMIENNKEEHNIQLICQKYIALIQLAHTYGIENCYQWKHLVDGKRAAQVVGVKPGPVLTELLKIQMTWQLENPQGTKEECEKALEEYWKSK
ncbi:CCA tRNA nucleotidyltransferase, mitochondrial [Choanephora cucurbitarum]|uniref:CCA tRNA nucleotidyltransferase, mitochondrial n=1 Tax=Choanephora cucurbitarum TaxID=101091 RepID=A0A1C7NP95_9FUNG|nr:CCA tRNA nucleotidyltransferase, mitochondrial [Choanephora cucurbitarum]